MTMKDRIHNTGNTPKGEDGDHTVSTPAESPAHPRRQKQNKTRYRFATLLFVLVYTLAYRALGTSPSMVVSTAGHQAVKNATELSLLRQSHIENVASAISRVYEPVAPSGWCVDGRLKEEQAKRKPMGLCYLRIGRAASTTLAGINQRIAQNFARRQGLQTCIRHDGKVGGLYYSGREELSFLWTFVRDPASRALSRIASNLAKQAVGGGDVFHSMNHSAFTIRALKNSNDIVLGAVSEGRGGFQLQQTMQHIIAENSAWNESEPGKVLNPQMVQGNVREVLNEFNFIGVVERFDESLVALQLLLGVEPQDLLQFAVRTHTQYIRVRNHKENNKYECRLSSMDPNALRTPPVRNYFQSAQWWAQNYGDHLLYQAASQSLDKTIKKIGIKFFSEALKKFRNLQALAESRCSPVLLCSSNGTEQSEHVEKDCYGEDVGCGYHCLDSLAKEIELQPQANAHV